jgi:hypothetical protein
MKFKSYDIAIIPSKECNDGDFVTSGAVNSFKSLDDYTGAESPDPALGILLLNSRVITSIDDRKKIASLFRSVIPDLSQKVPTIKPIDSHFLKRDLEPGSSNVVWPMSPVADLSIKNIRIGIERIPLTKNRTMVTLHELLKSKGFKIEWIDLNNENVNADTLHGIWLYNNAVEKRQPWIQEISKNRHSTKLIDAFPKTRNAVKMITEKSSATLPVEEEHLRDFEDSSFTETSFIPIFRASTMIYSRKTIPIEVVYVNGLLKEFRERK